MTGCLIVEIFGLPQEVQNYLQCGSSVQLDPGETPRLSKAAQKLSVLNKIEIEGALGATFPESKTNNAVFGAFRTAMTLDNRIEFYDCRVVIDGYETSLKRLYVKGRIFDQKAWDIEVKVGADHWIELTKFPINELDYGGFGISKTAILSNWELPVYEGDFHLSGSGQRPYYWPLIDYGGWCDQTEPPQDTEEPVKTIAAEDFRPLISQPFLLKAGFCHIGWTLEGAIFDAEFVKRLWLYRLSPNYYTAGKLGDRITGRRFDRYDIAIAADSANLRFTEKVKGSVAIDLFMPYPGLGGDAWMLGIKNNRGAVALKYKFKMVGEFHNDRALAFTPASFLIEEIEETAPLDYQFTGEVLSEESLDVVFAPFEKKTVVFEQEVVIKAGQSAAIRIPVLPSSGFFVEKGLYFEVVPANESLTTGDVIEVRDCIDQSYQLLEEFKAFVHLVNGRIDTDEVTKTVTVYPDRRVDLFTDVVAPFVLDEEESVDIRDLIVPGSIRTKPVRPDLKRYTRLEFADSTDAYIESLTLQEPAHSRTMINGEQYPDEIESIPNPVNEPTIEGQMTGVASGWRSTSGYRGTLPYIPRMWDNVDGNRSFDIGPRILFAYGMVQQENPAPIGVSSEFTSFFFDVVPNTGNSGLTTDFGYATQLRTWKFETEPAMIGNVVFGKEKNDLFVLFWLGITQQSRGGTSVDLLMYLSMSHYAEERFRKKNLFEIDGMPVAVPKESIRDFDGCGKIATPVTFFLSPQESECCDLPCGCQFTTCDYYQDFGPLLRQDTLNQMRVASFVVDGQELITTPLSFGFVNVVDIGGMPFVTNLVDTLNSVAAPYFYFLPSTRSHPEKGKRFFTIKHLACQPFRILITLDGADTYLYTQDQQLSQYFNPGTWEAIGYDSETFTEPDNCSTVTEY